MPSKQSGSTLGEFKKMLPCIMYIVDTIIGNGLSNGRDYIISFLNHSLDIHGIAGLKIGLLRALKLATINLTLQFLLKQLLL